MSYQLILSAEARQDTIDSYNYYESQRKGLGEEFLNALELSYSILAEHPHLFGYTDAAKILRDLKVKRFPFVIIYEISDNEIFVYSIHHTSRFPR